MIGSRLIKLREDEDLLASIAFTPGAYGTVDGVTWYGTTPNGLFANLRSHSVVEHHDGSITVSPSILVTTGLGGKDPQWHGYLERGVWREC